MKIGPGSDAASLAPLTNGSADAAKSARPVPAATAEASAQVALSETVQTLRSGAGGASFDADKVARISQAIENGTFKINAEAIADKLIANAQEVLGQAGKR